MELPQPGPGLPPVPTPGLPSRPPPPYGAAAMTPRRLPPSRNVTSGFFATPPAAPSFSLRLRARRALSILGVVVRLLVASQPPPPRLNYTSQSAPRGMAAAGTEGERGGGG